MKTGSEGPRAIVLGLDGATLDLIEPWAEAGALPNLASLMASGARGRLQSTLPFITPLAWPAIHTGTNPGQHGIFGFRKRLPGTYRWALNSSVDLERPPIWEILGAQGLRSAVLFVPFTYPARPFPGVMIAGAFGPGRLDPRSVHPQTLEQQIGQRFDPELLFRRRQKPGRKLPEVARLMCAGVREQTDAMVHLLQQEDFDFVFTVWHDTDKAAHILWHHSDLPHPDTDSLLCRVYQEADRSIGRILEAAGGDPLVVVCSDHGTYPVTHRVNIHLWLQQHGLMTMKDFPGRKVVAEAGRRWRQLPGPAKNMVPLRLRRRLHRSVQDKMVRQNAQVDWANTALYPEPTSGEALWLNLHGREPQGQVVPATIDSVLDKAASELLALSDERGTRLVRAVHRKDDLYSGPHLDRAPDLVAELESGTMFAPSGIGESEVISSPPRPDFERDEPTSLGYHQRDGLVILAGPQVRSESQISATVTDIAPTILRHLGVAMPRDLDGSAIEAAFADLPSPLWLEEGLAYQPVPPMGLTPAEEEEVAAQLKDLGYIE